MVPGSDRIPTSVLPKTHYIDAGGFRIRRSYANPDVGWIQVNHRLPRRVNQTRRSLVPTTQSAQINDLVAHGDTSRAERPTDLE